jgi:hypothetical protein
MADFTLSKPIFGGKPKTSTAGNIAYALFVLLLLGRLAAAQYAGPCAGRL